MDRQNLKFIFISKRVVPSYLGLYQVVPDNSYHNINNGVGPWAAATLVTDQVVLVVLQCSALTTEAEDSELTIVKIMLFGRETLKIMHITHQDRASCYV